MPVGAAEMFLICWFLRHRLVGDIIRNARLFLQDQDVSQVPVRAAEEVHPWGRLAVSQ